MQESKTRMTLSAAVKKYPNEWVVFQEPRFDSKSHSFVDGKLFFHHADRKAAFKRASTLDKPGAIFFTGDPKYRKVTVDHDEIGKAAA